MQFIVNPKMCFFLFSVELSNSLSENFQFVFVVSGWDFIRCFDFLPLLFPWGFRMWLVCNVQAYKWELCKPGRQIMTRSSSKWHWCYRAYRVGQITNILLCPSGLIWKHDCYYPKLPWIYGCNREAPRLNHAQLLFREGWGSQLHLERERHVYVAWKGF